MSSTTDNSSQLTQREIQVLEELTKILLTTKVIDQNLKESLDLLKTARDVGVYTGLQNMSISVLSAVKEVIELLGGDIEEQP